MNMKDVDMDRGIEIRGLILRLILKKHNFLSFHYNIKSI